MEIKTMKRNDEGFTGLEAAIVLIAFVVVAAVFSYVMLGAGFFTSQKSQEVVHTSVSQASSSIQEIGDVYGVDSDGSDNTINYLEFSIGLTAGGSPVDMSKAVLTYSTASEVYTLTQESPLVAVASTTNPGEGKWLISQVNNEVNAGSLLEGSEQFVIKANVKDALGVNTQFSLEVKPPVGAVLGMVRSTPPQIDEYNVLY